MTTVRPDRIMNLANAFYDSCVLFTASDLGIFKQLAAASPADAAAVAAALELDPRATRRLMDACVALDLLTKEGGAYRNTPEAAAFLVPGAAGDLMHLVANRREINRFAFHESTARLDHYREWEKVVGLVAGGLDGSARQFRRRYQTEPLQVKVRKDRQPIYLKLTVE